VYGLDTLSKKNFSSTGAHSSTSQAPVVHQIEEMSETDIAVVRRSNYHYFSNFSIASL